MISLTHERPSHQQSWPGGVDVRFNTASTALHRVALHEPGEEDVGKVSSAGGGQLGPVGGRGGTARPSPSPDVPPHGQGEVGRQRETPFEYRNVLSAPERLLVTCSNATPREA